MKNYRLLTWFSNKKPGLVLSGCKFLTWSCQGQLCVHTTSPASKSAATVRSGHLLEVLLLCLWSFKTLLSSDSQIKLRQTEGKFLHLSTYRKRQKLHLHVNVSQSTSTYYHQSYLESGIQLVSDPHLYFPPLYWQQKIRIIHVLILWNTGVGMEPIWVLAELKEKVGQGNKQEYEQ